MRKVLSKNAKVGTETSNFQFMGKIKIVSTHNLFIGSIGNLQLCVKKLCLQLFKPTSRCVFRLIWTHAILHRLTADHFAIPSALINVL